MKLTHDTRLQQTTGLKLSQNMRHLIGFLGMSNAEIAEAVALQAADNPLLEVRFAPAGAGGSAGADMAAVAVAPDLHAHVMAQLPSLLPDAAAAPLALALLGALDASGFVSQPLAQIAATCGCAPARAEAVLKALQRAEPTGLFARALPECLELQLREQELWSPAFAALVANLPLVAEGRFTDLAGLCGLDDAALAAHLKTLRGLDPRPAGPFSHRPAPTRIPDLVVQPAPEGGWAVTLNPDTLPVIRLRAAAIGPLGGAHRRVALREAQQLQRVLDMRNRSLLALGQRLAQQQPDFLARGVAHLRPLTMRAVAADLALHESTVGRMANTAAMQTGLGVVPLRAFFGHAPSRGDVTAELAAPAIAARIADRIAREDPQQPFSDPQIADWLQGQGVAISRRTVAKYRAAAGIADKATRRRRGRAG